MGTLQLIDLILPFYDIYFALHSVHQVCHRNNFCPEVQLNLFPKSFCRPSRLHWSPLKLQMKPSLGARLTLNMQGLGYHGLTRSISWLLMSWQWKGPWHQHPWCWLCRIGMSLLYLKKAFNYLGHVNVEEWHKIWIYIFVHSEKIST